MRRFRIELSTGEYINVEIDEENNGVMKVRIIGEDKEYNVRIISFDEELKRATIEINGEIVRVNGLSSSIVVNSIPAAVKRVIELIPTSISMKSLEKIRGISYARKGVITAPISGKIVDIKVKPGDKVSRDSVIALMESMKMVTEIKAGMDGIVEEIYVKIGKAINKGERIARIRPIEK